MKMETSSLFGLNFLGRSHDGMVWLGCVFAGCCERDGRGRVKVNRIGGKIVLGKELIRRFESH